jgi:nitrogen regulatory protein PII
MKEIKAYVRISKVDVFVTPVERAVKIRSGDEAPQSLRK